MTGKPLRELYYSLVSFSPCQQKFWHHLARLLIWWGISEVAWWEYSRTTLILDYHVLLRISHHRSSSWVSELYHHHRNSEIERDEASLTSCGFNLLLDDNKHIDLLSLDPFSIRLKNTTAEDEPKREPSHLIRLTLDYSIRFNIWTNLNIVLEF